MSTALPPNPLGTSAELVRRFYGSSPFRTDGDLITGAFTPDGLFWSLEEPGTIRLWDLAEAKQLEWHPLEELATAWAFNGNGSQLAGASSELTVWDTASGEVLQEWPQRSWVTALAFCPAGRLLATGHDTGVVRVWEWQEQKLLFELVGHPLPVSALAFRRDGQVLATAGEDRSIRLWDVTRGVMTGSLLGHTDRISGLAWHPDGRRLVSTGWDTTARVWDATTGKPIILLNSHAGQVYTLAFSPDGSQLACADSDHAIHLWDMTGHRLIDILRDRAHGEVRFLAWHPSKPLLVFGGAERILHQWNVSAHGEGLPGRGAEQALRTSLALDVARGRLIGLSPEGTVQGWEIDSAAPAPVLAEDASLVGLAVSPDGQWLVGGLDVRPEPGKPPEEFPFSLGLWDLASGVKLDERCEQRGPITLLAFSPNAPVVAAANRQSNDVWVWKVEQPPAPEAITLEPVVLLNGCVEQCAVEILAWSPAGDVIAVGAVDHLATGGNDGHTALWHVQERKCLGRLPGGVQSVAWHPSGNTLATAALDGFIRIWDVQTLSVVSELKGHLGTVRSAVYSPDGKWLVSTSDDHTIRLWNTASGEQHGLVELDTKVQTVCFSRDGAFLFTGNANASAYQLETSALTR